MIDANKNVPFEKIRPYIKAVYKNADVFMHKIVIGFFVFGLFLTIFYETYILGFTMGSVFLGTHLLVRYMMPLSIFHRHVVGVLLVNFSLQYILQMRGIFEMHFLLFISITLLLYYETWKVFITASLYLALITVFMYYFGEEWMGLGEYLENMDKLSVSSFTIYVMLILVHGIFCMLQANMRRNKTIEEARRYVYVSEKAQYVSGNMEFADEISKGNLEATYNLEKGDDLGKSLINMRESLVKASKREERERFINSGLASIGDILRNHVNNFDLLCDKVIAKLVDYTNANQGGHFHY